MSELQRYVAAMRYGWTHVCEKIEQKFGLYGYPPEVVSVGLKAFDEGRDVYAAVDDYVNGAQSESQPSTN